MGKRYKNPPIIEAVCEIQFERDTPWNITVPGLLYEKLRDTFPRQREAVRVNLGISAAPGTLSQEFGAMPLIQFLREDEQALVQVGQYLLAINHLKPYPYPGWETFSPMIERAFQAYREVAAPTSIHRIGLRYINRVEFPGERIDLEDYFEFYPFIGKQLPQDFTAFFVGAQIPYAGERDVLKLQLTSINAEAPGQLAFLLDLDYFLSRPGEVTLDEAAQWIHAAHGRLEDAFEASIKDSLRERFEEVTA